ncbi:MAG: TlpA family protein disulfide reductase [Actinomycetota bacterium]|nr:TlpA family protein disulfide reductase [Actinomycetota bacterium]
MAIGQPAGFPAAGTLQAASAQELQNIIVGARGRPVVVNLWASWCGPCRTEAPLLQRAHSRYGSDVAFLGVDSQDSADAARDFLRRYDITYPNVVDADGSIAALLSMRGLPTTYVFDRNGRITAAVLGGISEQTLAARLRDALGR